MKLRTIPADSKGYPGMIGITWAENREIIALGSGPEAERIVREAAGKKMAELTFPVDG